MEKRKLVLEQLQVESFTTAADAAERGTVEGHQLSEPYVCRTYEYCTCNDGVSDRSCRATCYDGSGCGPGNSGNPFTCLTPNTCDIEGTCGGCTGYTTPC